MYNRLFARTDNAPLVIFRIFLGFLLACECFGAIATGWVKKFLITPEFTFTHIGLSWLRPLPGNGMYFYYAAMGVLGLLVMLGYKYRYSIAIFTILWAGTYFMQKTAYNNHYYLLMLVCFMMCFLPANRYAAIDAKQNPQIKTLSMPAWCSWVMIAQVAIVYFYATLAKFYPGWLDGSFTKIILENAGKRMHLQHVFTQKWFYLFIAYAGIAFDMLVVPLLLFKRTRTIAFIASLIFHIFNSITLQIGIFPFFALSFAVFFYPPEKIRKLFFRNKPPVTQDFAPTPSYKGIFYYVFVPYLILQLALPLRHYFIKGDVLWTEEGHRLSWRMMLRTRTGHTHFKIVDKATGKEVFFPLMEHLTASQYEAMNTRPDMIWQMAQYIKKHFDEKDIEVAVYANTWASINRKPYQRLIDNKTDLATAKWDYFFHCSWILLYDENSNLIK